MGLFRVEVSVSSGSGKLKAAGGLSGAIKESIIRAFGYLQGHKNEFGIAREIEVNDFHVEVIDLLGNRVEAEVGVAFLAAVFSAIKRTPVQAAMLVMGDMSIQGNIKAVRSLTEPLQIGMDNGVRRVLIPTENKRSFLEVSSDVLEKVDPIFYGDVRGAAFKALGIN